MATNNNPLKQLSVMAGKDGLSSLHIPTITDGAEDVVGLQGRIRLQKDHNIVNSRGLDKIRETLQAYEYLCHIGEAKEWIENCLQETIDPVIQLEETMRNGIILAKLAAWFTDGVVKKIFYGKRLEFRHSDNINYFLEALAVVRLPDTFWFEFTDLYDKKNIPRVIYCIHALSHLLARRNLAPSIKNLYGQLQFTDEELHATQRNLDSCGTNIPNFMDLRPSLYKELHGDDSFRHHDDHRFNKSPTTPDLIIEESDESDHETMTEQERFELYWSDSENLERLKTCQNIARKWLAHREMERQRQELHKSTYVVSHLSRVQAHARGMLQRRDMEDKHITYESSEDWVIKLQTHVRGCLARLNYRHTLDHYNEHLDKVIMVQNFVKNKMMGKAYRRLTSDSNPSIGTVKNFVHLLDDSDLDFDRELALEDLRQKVIQQIRENDQMDAHVNALDIQICLFLRNAITIDEVVKSTSAFKKKQQRRRMSELAASTRKSNPYSLRGVDKESRTRLELYQRLLYLLQTEPGYLARMLSMCGRRELDSSISTRLIESTVLSLFGYATNAREEYLLINLCKCCIDEELSYVENAQEFMRGNYTFMKLVVQTNRGAKERMFFRRLLTPLVESIVQDEYLDLETDPVAIYHKVINEEESRTGRPSMRKHSATVQEALQDQEVCDTFLMHLRNLREITTRFLNAITSTVDEVPYGIRIIARKLRVAMEESFPEEKEQAARIIGNFIYYRYLNPAIVAPEQYDVIDAVVLPVQRKNLAEVAKMLHQISSGKKFDADNMFLAPLNEYVRKSSDVFEQWFMKLTDVEEPETYFDIPELNDQMSTHKPTVYTTPYELFHLHHALQQHLDDLEPGRRNGPLQSLLTELGPSPYYPQLELPDSILCLKLTHPSDNIPMDPAARERQLLVDSKRLVIYTIKIQSGESLQSILESPTPAELESEWEALKAIEFSQQEEGGKTSKRRFVKLSQTDPPLDLQSLAFHQLKVVTSRLLYYLTRTGAISAEGGYQEMINMIARDITGKTSRRQQRDNELTRLGQTLKNVVRKRHYLTEQRTQYEDYLKECMTIMAKKRGRRPRYGLPFTRQYFHVRALKKQGLEPTFGSFKYSGKQLYERGILVDVDGIEPKDYDKINIILSMDTVGIITIEGAYSRWPIPSVQVDMRYEELLQTQFEGAQTMQVLDGLVKVNVNLLIFLINKKFYA